jgi:heme exporter protein A
MAQRQPHTPELNIDKIAIIRGNRLVINMFSLGASAGDVIWIRGANGSGKSTLLRAVAHLIPVSAGSVQVSGKIAMADENMALDANLSVEAALGFWAAMDRSAADVREAALTAMDLVGLANVPVRYLSTGQRKRANLARVLASQASIWLLDEPYNGLDSASTARLDAELLRHSNAGGIALVAAHQAPSINVAQSISLDAKRPSP